MNWQRVDNTWMRLERGLYTSVPWGHTSRHWWGGWWVCDKDQTRVEALLCLVPALGVPRGWEWCQAEECSCLL